MKHLHQTLFYLFLFLIPIQTRILYNPSTAYIDWYFNYHLAFFVYLTDLALITCFITWLLYEEGYRVQGTGHRIFCLTLAFLTIAGVSLFRVEHLNLGIYQLLKWLELFLIIFYVSSTFKQASQFLKAAWVIFISAILQAFIGIWQFHVQHGLGLSCLGEYIAPLGTPGLATIYSTFGKIIRAYGTLPHPNVFGAFLIFGLFMGFFIGWRVQGRKYRVLVSCGTILITLGIFVSFSRLAWLAAAIGFLGLGLYYWAKKAWKPLFLLGCIVIVSCGTIFLAYRPYLENRIQDTIHTTISVTDRKFFNQMALNVFSDQPVWGAGTGNYIDALKGQRPSLLPWQYQPPHNIFIAIAAELGIVGLILLAAILYAIFSSTGRSRNSLLKFTLLTLGLLFLLLGQFDHYFVTIQQGRLMFFTLLGLLAALPNLNSSSYDKIDT